MFKSLLLLISHGAVLAVGFALGVFLLPIITEPPSPDTAKLEQMATDAVFTAELSRDLKGNDFLHWGEGTISLSATQIVHQGKLAAGPDYKLYLLNDFVEDEAGFLPFKQDALQVGDVKTFSGFILDIPPGVNVADYSTVLIWCEAFGEFITAARYQ